MVVKYSSIRLDYLPKVFFVFLVGARNGYNFCISDGFLRFPDLSFQDEMCFIDYQPNFSIRCETAE